MHRGSAGQPGGAVSVAVDGGDRGEALQTFACEGQDDQLAAQSELLAESVASCVYVAGQQRGQRGVSVHEHP